MGTSSGCGIGSNSREMQVGTGKRNVVEEGFEMGVEIRVTEIGVKTVVE